MSCHDVRSGAHIKQLSRKIKHEQNVFAEMMPLRLAAKEVKAGSTALKEETLEETGRRGKQKGCRYVKSTHRVYGLVEHSSCTYCQKHICLAIISILLLLLTAPTHCLKSA